MKKRNHLTVSLMVAIFMLACSMSGLPFGGEEQPTPELPVIPVVTESVPTEAPAPLGNVAFSDDFSAPSTEMETYSGDGGSAGTENGVYVLRSTADLWQWGKSNTQFENVIVEADVTMIAGPANNNAGFGIVCRLSTKADDSIDGYMLAISGDGYYTIRSITSSSMTALVDWAFSDAVNQGPNATNHLRATCNGSELKLEVNGQLIASANAIATGSNTGSIAFAAISFETDQPYAEAHFDNLIVSQP